MTFHANLDLMMLASEHLEHVVRVPISHLATEEMDRVRTLLMTPVLEDEDGTVMLLYTEDWHLLYDLLLDDWSVVDPV